MTEVKLELLIDIDMLLMVKKDIRGGKNHQFIDMQKLIISISMIMMRIKNHFILNIGV